MRGMFRSKRFVAFAVAVVLYVAMVLLTSYPPMEVATSISIITGIYIGAETFRTSGSEKQ